MRIAGLCHGTHFQAHIVILGPALLSWSKLKNSPCGPHTQAICKLIKGGVHSSCQWKSPNYSRRLLIGPTLQADEMSHMAGSTVVANLKLLMANSKSTNSDWNKRRRVWFIYIWFSFKNESCAEIESIANQILEVNPVFLRTTHLQMAITFNLTVGSMKFTYHWKAYSE